MYPNQYKHLRLSVENLEDSGNLKAGAHLYFSVHSAEYVMLHRVSTANASKHISWSESIVEVS
jgi:hypothetical protein